jgi:hypothetical protein
VDEIRKGASLIRQQFNIDPYTLEDEDFAELVCEALWLKEYDREQTEYALLKAMAVIFAKKK